MNDADLPGWGRWLDDLPPDADIIWSSRVRLARNLAGWKFPHHTSAEERGAVIRAVSGAVAHPAWAGGRLVELEKMSPVVRLALSESGFISREMTEGEGRAAWVSDSEGWSLMVNEEDHLRLQVVRAGLTLREVWAQAMRLDEALEEKLTWAYSPEWGYLTACPTNVGTGLRASCMLHLPGLVAMDRIRQVLKALAQLGLAVRGLAGEGSEHLGDFYQISNQVTLGRSEEDLLGMMTEVARQLLHLERKARMEALAGDGLRVRDQMGRALGILANCRLITFGETMEHLSRLYWGIGAGVVRGIRLGDVRRLVVLLQPAHIRLGGAVELRGEGDEGARQRDEVRAQLVRDHFSGGTIA